jgi:hypothetical protein
MMMMMKTTVRRLLPLRFLSTGAPSSSSAARGPRLDPGPLSFEDPGAFRVKSTKELLRALAVFRFCSVPLLVNNCDKVRTPSLLQGRQQETFCYVLCYLDRSSRSW